MYVARYRATRCLRRSRNRLLVPHSHRSTAATRCAVDSTREHEGFEPHTRQQRPMCHDPGRPVDMLQTQHYAALLIRRGEGHGIPCPIHLRRTLCRPRAKETLTSHPCKGAAMHRCRATVPKTAHEAEITHHGRRIARKVYAWRSRRWMQASPQDSLCRN